MHRNSGIKDSQCGFHLGRSTTDQIFTLRQIFEKFWEYANVFECFVDLKKAKTDKMEILSRWRVCKEDLLNAVRETPTGTCDSIDFGKARF